MKINYSNLLMFGCFFGLSLPACKSEKSADSVPVPQVDAVTSPPKDSVVEKSEMRAPKQNHPELVTNTEPPNSIEDRLNEAIASAKGDVPALKKKFSQLWDEGVAGFASAPLLSSNDVEIANGAKLPKEIEPVILTSLPHTEGDTAEGLMRGVGMWSAILCGDQITQFVHQKANSLPPTTADIAIYEALNMGVQEFSQSRGSNSYSPFEPWEKFSNAANPIYRLLALRAAPLTVSKAAWDLSPESDEFNRVNASAKLGFYLSFLDEKDPVILKQTIRSLASIPHPEARQAIEKFHTQQLELGDKTMIQAAEEALRTQKAVSK